MNDLGFPHPRFGDEGFERKAMHLVGLESNSWLFFDQK